MKIYTEDESMDVDVCDIDSLAAALEFKGMNIESKVDPRIFLAAASKLRSLRDSRAAWKRNAYELLDSIRKMKGYGCGGLIRREDVFHLLAMPMDDDVRAKIYIGLQEMEGIEL